MAGEQKLSTAGRLFKYLIAILAGNALYFLLSPYLPPAAQRASSGFNLGTLVDLWFCLFVYGVMELATYLRSRRKP